MTTKKTMIFGLREFIRSFTGSENNLPLLAYKLIFELENIPDKKLETAIQELGGVLDEYELPMSCPKCDRSIPEWVRCIYCGSRTDGQEDLSIPKNNNGFKDYMPPKKGTQRCIVEDCIREGMHIDDILSTIKEASPGRNFNDKTLKNNIYIYLSTWRKEYGWEIIREDGVVRLVSTNGNG